MHPRRVLRAAVVGAAVCTSAALAIPALPAVAASRAASSAHATSYVIFLRTPSAHVTTRAERAAVRGSQSALATQLATLGVTVHARSLVPDTITASLTGAQLAALRTSPAVSHVFVNGWVQLATPQRVQLHFHASKSRSAAADHADGGNGAVCGTAAHPQLNPEALSNIDALPAIQDGWNGTGVKLAFIADGVDPAIADFHRNAQFASAGSPTGSPVITDKEDFSGDGTSTITPGGEAFIDAGSMVAQANTTYDLSNYVNPAHPLPAGCDVRIEGDAPGATLEALDVFSVLGRTTESNFIQAISYAVTTGVKVLNESFGSNNFPDSSLDATRLADDAAVAAGVTVVVSSGDAGINSTIGSPATDPNMIAVGATTTFRLYRQDTFGGINVPGVGNGRVADDNISSLSSGGFAQNGKTVDLVAPGDLNWGLCSPSPLYAGCSGGSLEQAGGTSESAPLTAGAAADVIQAYAASHHGAFPSPALVKHILTSSATDTNAPGEQQGAGLLDIAAAVDLARSIAGTTAHHTEGGLLASTSQLDLSGMPNTTATGTVSLTNTSDSPQVLFPYARQLAQTGSSSGTVTMDPSVPTSEPHFPIWSGVQEIYQLATFKVPHGTDRLKLDAAYQYTGQGSLLHFAVFNPDGTYEGYSLPQGLGDYGDVQVANPESGTWTVAFFTEWDGSPVLPGTGTSGPVPWTASFWRWQRVGDTDPGFTFIPPGATRDVKLHLGTGSQPGDSGYSLVLGDDMTIPVTLRTFVPVTPSSSATFSGVLTGGNGRNAPGAFSPPAQMDTYVFNVPAGQHDLDASIAMGSNPGAGFIAGDELNAYLVDPNGLVVAYDTNYNANGNPSTPYLQLYRANPTPGQYQLVLDWVQPLSGVATAVPFTASVQFNLVSVASALPDSASSTISATSGATYGVTVNNTGVAPILVSTDARLPTTQTFTLPDFFGTPTTQQFPGSGNTFFVPTETSTYNVSVAASVPATFDTSWQPGDPDISPQTGGAGVTSTGPGFTSSISYTPGAGAFVDPGLWSTIPSQVGPYGASPTTLGTETTTVTATALAFDPAVSSPAGDEVQSMTTGGVAGIFLPAVILPGTSATIPVKIMPTAPVSSTVSGTLYIDGIDAATFIPTLDQTEIFTNDVAAIPYEYTVSP